MYTDNNESDLFFLFVELKQQRRCPICKQDVKDATNYVQQAEENQINVITSNFSRFFLLSFFEYFVNAKRNLNLAFFSLLLQIFLCLLNSKIDVYMCSILYSACHRIGK